MSLVITNIQRTNTSPCQHFLLTASEDGEPHTVEITRDDLRDRGGDNPRLELILLWICYRLNNGATIASLIGQTVA